MKQPRTAAFILFVFSVIVLLACCGSITVEAHHECTGEHCPICAHMRLCMDIVHSLGLERFLVVLWALMGASLMTAANVIMAARLTAPTPVMLRVRQNS